MTNTELLNDKIAESGLKKNFIAGKLGITPYGLQLKTINKNEFKASEISTLCDLLSIRTAREKDDIFFAKQVD